MLSISDQLTLVYRLVDDVGGLSSQTGYLRKC
jgi:hypothetical protein